MTKIGIAISKLLLMQLNALERSVKLKLKLNIGLFWSKILFLIAFIFAWFLYLIVAILTLSKG